MTTLESVITTEQQAAEHGWRFFLTATYLIADLGDWQHTETDGGAVLSARVSGPQAVEAVRRFAEYGDTAGTAGVFQRATLDYAVRGRVAAVWRSNGVWVELWCTEPSRPAPAPVGAPAAPSQASSSVPSVRPQPLKARLLSRPSGRLPFTRRTKTSKENPAA